MIKGYSLSSKESQIPLDRRITTYPCSSSDFFFLMNKIDMSIQNDINLLRYHFMKYESQIIMLYNLYNAVYQLYYNKSGKNRYKIEF